MFTSVGLSVVQWSNLRWNFFHVFLPEKRISNSISRAMQNLSHICGELALHTVFHNWSGAYHVPSRCIYILAGDCVLFHNAWPAGSAKEVLSKCLLNSLNLWLVTRAMPFLNVHESLWWLRREVVMSKSEVWDWEMPGKKQGFWKKILEKGTLGLSSGRYQQRYVSSTWEWLSWG